MRVRQLKTMAGPAGVIRAGEVHEVDAAVVQDLVAAGVVVPLEPMPSSGAPPTRPSTSSRKGK